MLWLKAMAEPFNKFINELVFSVYQVAGLFLFIMYIRTRRFAKDTKAVTEKISAMQAGKETEPLSFPRRSLLCKTASELNTLENGIEAAIEQRNRSNKMRVELITNVSHDLKAPLTSIINYADTDSIYCCCVCSTSCVFCIHN